MSLKTRILDLKKQHFGVIIDSIYGVTHNSCYFRRKGGNEHSKTSSTGFLFIGCHLWKLWFIHSHSTHLFHILRDNAVHFFPAFLGEESSPRPPPPNLYFLLNLGNFLCTQSKPLHSFSLHASKMKKVFLLASEVFQWPLRRQIPEQKSIPGQVIFKATSLFVISPVPTSQHDWIELANLGLGACDLGLVPSVPYSAINPAWWPWADYLFH